MIALIDYGSGNIRSVMNALRHERADVELISDPARLDEAAAIVLPGVGAFGDCVRGLQKRELWEPLQAWLAADRPFFGICVGYQMLFDGSEESPGVNGFGFFGGEVQKFTTPGLKVPQIGWNQLALNEPGMRSGGACPRSRTFTLCTRIFPWPRTKQSSRHPPLMERRSRPPPPGATWRASSFTPRKVRRWASGSCEIS